MANGDRFITGAESWSQVFQTALLSINQGIRDFRSNKIQMEQLKLAKRAHKLEESKFKHQKLVDVMAAKRDSLNMHLDMLKTEVEIAERFGKQRAAEAEATITDLQEQATSINERYKESVGLAQAANDKYAAEKQEWMLSGHTPALMKDGGYTPVGATGVSGEGAVFYDSSKISQYSPAEGIFKEFAEKNKSWMEKAKLNAGHVRERAFEEVPLLFERIEDGSISQSELLELNKYVAELVPRGDTGKPGLLSIVDKGTLSDEEREIVLKAYLLKENTNTKFANRIKDADLSYMAGQLERVDAARRESFLARANETAAEAINQAQIQLLADVVGGNLRGKIGGPGGYAALAAARNKFTGEAATYAGSMLNAQNIPEKYRQTAFSNMGFAGTEYGAVWNDPTFQMTPELIADIHALYGANVTDKKSRKGLAARMRRIRENDRINTPDKIPQADREAMEAAGIDIEAWFEDAKARRDYERNASPMTTNWSVPSEAYTGRSDESYIPGYLAPKTPWRTSPAATDTIPGVQQPDPMSGFFGEVPSGMTPPEPAGVAPTPPPAAVVPLSAEMGGALGKKALEFSQGEVDFMTEYGINPEMVRDPEFIRLVGAEGYSESAYKDNKKRSIGIGFQLENKETLKQRYPDFVEMWERENPGKSFDKDFDSAKADPETAVMLSMIMVDNTWDDFLRGTRKKVGGELVNPANMDALEDSQRWALVKAGYQGGTGHLTLDEYNGYVSRQFLKYLGAMTDGMDKLSDPSNYTQTGIGAAVLTDEYAADMLRLVQATRNAVIAVKLYHGYRPGVKGRKKWEHRIREIQEGLIPQAVKKMIRDNRWNIEEWFRTEPVIKKSGNTTEAYVPKVKAG